MAGYPQGMATKKSHNITPEPDEVKRAPRPKTKREQQQERAQALISPDRGRVSKPKQKGPLSVGVNFDNSQG
jgi:hypothetical protein